MGPVRWGYLRPDQFLDHLTVIIIVYSKTRRITYIHTTKGDILRGVQRVKCSSRIVQQTPIDNNWVTWAKIRNFGPQANIRHFKLILGVFAIIFDATYWCSFFVAKCLSELDWYSDFFCRQTTDLYPEKEWPPSFLNLNLVSSEFFLNYSKFSKQVPRFSLWFGWRSDPMVGFKESIWDHPNLQCRLPQLLSSV